MQVRHIELYTKNLSDLKSFYSHQLGFSLLEESDQHFIMACGQSHLQFIASSQPAYYHFAFNIPSFQSTAALTWLKDRLSILKDGQQEIIDFRNWNAEAIYFKDPAGNIVEFIARKNLNLHNTTPFSVSSILSISEIGISVGNVKSAFDLLATKASIPHYWGDQQNFSAAGDEHGLFIIVNKNNKDWYPTNIPAKSFPLKVTFRNEDQDFTLVYKDETLKVSKQLV